MATPPMLIDLADPATYAHGHPWDVYRWLRDEAPVWRHPDTERAKGFFVLSRYDDVRTVSRQPRTFSSHAGGVMMEDSDEMSLGAARLMMLNMDPPQHDRFRHLVSRGFTPRNAQQLAPRIAELAREVVDDVIERGEADFVTDIAGRLPSGLIAEMMGIPREDGERLYELTELMHTTDPAVLERRMEALVEMLTYAGTVAAAKRANPSDDIASTLVHATMDDASGEHGLTDEEFAWFFLLLVNAGGDTTRNLLAAGMQLLFDHPEQLAKLQADVDGVLPTAVEEMLRYTSPVIYMRRTLLHDTAVRGRDLAAGDKLVMLYGAANRDADVFVDPDRFDVSRDPNPHLAFGGGGPHLCLGMHVARFEIAAMLREVLTRMPRLAPAGEPERMRSNFIAGVHSMPVRW